MGRKSRGKKLRRMGQEAVEQQETGRTPAGQNTPANMAKSGTSGNYPAILVEFVYPVLDPVNDDADDVKAKFSWGVSIWNKAVADHYPDHEIGRQVLDQFQLFMLMVPDEELVESFLQRKKHEFGQYHFFIVEHETHTDKLKGNISVSVRVVNIEPSGEGNHKDTENTGEHKEEE